jgi:hypothetical protein
MHSQPVSSPANQDTHPPPHNHTHTQNINGKTALTVYTNNTRSGIFHFLPRHGHQVLCTWEQDVVRTVYWMLNSLLRRRPTHCKYRNSLTHTRCWIIPTRCEWTYAKLLACALGTRNAIHVLKAITITIMYFKIQDWTSNITYDRRTVVNNYNTKLQ